MALNPTNPASTTVEVVSTESQEITEYHVDYWGVRKDANDPFAITLFLQWSAGFRDSGGTFVKVLGPHEIEEYTGTDVLTAVGAFKASGGYDSLAAETWGLLQSRGIVPEGTINT